MNTVCSKTYKTTVKMCNVNELRKFVGSYATELWEIYSVKSKRVEKVKFVLDCSDTAVTVLCQFQQFTYQYNQYEGRYVIQKATLPKLCRSVLRTYITKASLTWPGAVNQLQLGFLRVPAVILTLFVSLHAREHTHTRTFQITITKFIPALILLLSVCARLSTADYLSVSVVVYKDHNVRVRFSTILLLLLGDSLKDTYLLCLRDNNIIFFNILKTSNCSNRTGNTKKVQQS